MRFVLVRVRVSDARIAINKDITLRKAGIQMHGHQRIRLEIECAHLKLQCYVFDAFLCGFNAPNRALKPHNSARTMQNDSS